MTEELQRVRCIVCVGQYPSHQVNYQGKCYECSARGDSVDLKEQVEYYSTNDHKVVGSRGNVLDTCREVQSEVWLQDYDRRRKAGLA